MSAYYLGFLLGWALVPGLIRKVGYIRVFGAMGSLVSTMALLHALLVDPVLWFIIRLGTGFALCAVFITAESWLNSVATNETRGRLLGLYMIMVLGGIAAGQFLLNLAARDGPELFILVSILVSLAIVPMLLAAGPAPTPTVAARVGPLWLYRVSPLATVAIFAVGIAQGALYGGVAALYARSIGLPVPALSLFVALTILGGMLFQWPVGLLSDRLDRRLVITAVALAASMCAALAATTAAGPAVFVLFFLIGGLSLPLYSLCVAHANDFMTREEMVGASGALLLVNGVGSALGPTLGAAAIELAGTVGFPLYLAAVHGAIGVFALWRMTRRTAVPLAAQGPTIPIATATSTPVAAALVQEAAIEGATDAGEAATIARAG
jgi:MFS family permease